MKKFAPHIVLFASIALALMFMSQAEAAEAHKRLQTAYFAEGCFW